MSSLGLRGRSAWGIHLGRKRQALAQADLVMVGRGGWVLSLLRMLELCIQISVNAERLNTLIVLYL